MKDFDKHIENLKKICPNSKSILFDEDNDQIIISGNVYTPHLKDLINYSEKNVMCLYMTSNGLIIYPDRFTI